MAFTTNATISEPLRRLASNGLRLSRTPAEFPFRMRSQFPAAKEKVSDVIKAIGDLSLGFERIHSFVIQCVAEFFGVGFEFVAEFLSGEPVLSAIMFATEFAQHFFTSPGEGHDAVSV